MTAVAGNAMAAETLQRGQRFVAYPDNRPAERLFIEVTRVAKDGSWADIRVCTWAVMWTKRQPVKDGGLPTAVRRGWDATDLDEQMADWEAKRAGADQDGDK